MWQDLDPRPGRRESLAAAMRQLLRAFEAGDAVAASGASLTLCHILRAEVSCRLEQEPDWDDEARWLDILSTQNVFRLPPGRVRVYDAMFWCPKSNFSSRFWPEPFEADLRFSDDLMELRSSRIRFGDRRSFPGEGVHEGSARTMRDIEAGVIDWRFVWDEGTEPFDSR
jgi:hypothetical protein